MDDPIFARLETIERVAFAAVVSVAKVITLLSLLILICAVEATFVFKVINTESPEWHSSAAPRKDSSCASAEKLSTHPEGSSKNSEANIDAIDPD
jgi:hypothetical protein